MANQVIAIADLVRSANNAYYIRSTSNITAFSYDMVGKSLRVSGGTFPDDLLFITDVTVQDLGDGGSFPYFGLAQAINAGATGGMGSIIIGTKSVNGKQGDNLTVTRYGPSFVYDPESNLSPDMVGLQVTVTANSTSEGVNLGTYTITDCYEGQMDGPYAQKIPYFALAKLGTINDLPLAAKGRSASWALNGLGAKMPTFVPNTSFTGAAKGAIVGDSITNGGAARYASVLGEWFPNASQRIVANRGVDGSTSAQHRQGTANYNATVAALQAINNPTFVDICLGMNDSSTSVPVEQYVDNLRNLVEGLKRDIPSLKIIILNEPPWSTAEGRDTASLAAYRAALKDVGLGTVVGTMEIQAWTKATPGMQQDGVHPRDMGSRAMAIQRIRGLSVYLEELAPEPGTGGGGDFPTAEEIALAVRADMDANSTKLARLDANITSRSSHSALDIWNVVTAAAVNPLTFGKRVIDYLTGNAYTRLGAPENGSISADIAAVGTGIIAGKQIVRGVIQVKDVDNNLLDRCDYIAGDTEPALLVQFQDADGAPLDLSGSTVQLVMERPGTTSVVGNCVIESGTLGYARYDWGVNDLSVPGTFTAWFRRTAGGKRSTAGRIAIVVRADAP